MGDLLNDEEMARWSAWKRATESVWHAVGADIAADTGLSTSDFAVLTRVIEVDHGTVRQQRLADDLGWDRSRLSRHLARMEDRGLITRTPGTGERLITATTEGEQLATAARIAHARAVRAHLLDAIPPAAAGAFWHVVAGLSAPAGVTD
jgi:DNA-binding MarR family transcriptional regulator